MKFSIGKFFAWILVGFLLLGLLGFGITDVLVGRNSNTIAKVGNSKISAQEFARSFQQELRFYSQQLGKDISIDEAKSLGIPQVVLGKLINCKILESSLKSKLWQRFREHVRIWLPVLEAKSSFSKFQRF